MSAIEAGPEVAVDQRVDPSRAQMLRSLLAGLFWDVGASAAVYGAARLLGGSVFLALLLGAATAGLRAGWVVLRRREVDAFALFVVGVFAVGLGLSLWSGSPRFLLVKESFGTGAAGFAFVLTCLRGKPLAYYASQRVAAPTAEERAEWDQLWVDEPVIRRRFVVMSLVIGIALLAEAAVRVPLVFLLPPDAVVAISTILTPLVLAGISVWAVGYGARTEEAVARSHTD